MGERGVVFVGLDAGSVSVKLALLDAGGNILKTRYVRHRGRPLEVAYELLRDVIRDALCVNPELRTPNSELINSFSLSITGSAGRLIAHILGIEPVNEIVTQCYSVQRLYPQVKTIFEIGGEDSKLILFEDGKIKEFSMNSVCAAGTGSFLDQQAERLKLTIEEFSEIALRSKNPPRIAGRCSVFAKSDMIHLQQIATPLEDIIAGLCFAVVRNFKGSICKNMEIKEPVSFYGGVAANEGVIRAFREVFDIKNLIIPEYFAFMPAIGAALKEIETREVKSEKLKVRSYKEENSKIIALHDIEKLRTFIESQRSEEKGHEPLLNSKLQTLNSNPPLPPFIKEGQGEIRAYLGIDVGSISTNLAVIDEHNRLLAKSYLMTAGRPIEAVRQGLEEIKKEIGDKKVEICGVGTTGSGRYMIADFVGADIVKNEITAQATAAIAVDSRVDTIFEIGGQDSKYISIRDGVIVDFEMNKACAAGTGSFLEEQAEKLDISIREEFSKTAFQSQCPSCLGERCTVFMENSLLSNQQRGVLKEDLIAGLSYSIVQNYINRVVGRKRIGERIFFQGGVAFNTAVVSAFEKYLNKEITVPPHHEVTGAIGVALIAMKHMKNRKALSVMRNELRDKNILPVTDYASHITNFKGFDLSKRRYEIKSFGCKSCENLCEINSVYIEGEKEPLFYGSRCEKYDVRRKKVISSYTLTTDLFTEREELLTKTHNNYCKALSVMRNELKDKDISPVRLYTSRITHHAQRFRIGIPRIFYFHDFLPFWSTLLWELGFEVELSSKTNRQIINKGVENILSESCFPHKTAHGHIRDLIDKNVDAILIPSFINLNPSTNTIHGFACPYVQTMPYIARIAFRKNTNSFSNGNSTTLSQVRFLSPIVNRGLSKKYFTNEIYKALKPFHISMRKIEDALVKAERAQDEFVSSIKNKGKEILKNLKEKTIVIVGRSYNAFDSGINLDIPKKLSNFGIFSIPMDYLPIEDIAITDIWKNVYWRAGQNILKAGELIRDNPYLFALYIGNFSCGPDSFIHRYFKETMGSKPFLQLEIDEHSADAGVITRLEAFLDSIESQKSEVRSKKLEETLYASRFTHHASRFTPHASRIIYIPKMSDHAFGLQSAFEVCGVRAEVMDAPDIETVKIGRRYISGKECYPCVITTGDMVKKALSKDFNPQRSAFFMPAGTGPCRFGQYNVLHRLILNEIGYSHVPIFSPNQDTSFYKELGIVSNGFTKHAWKGVLAIELLIKCLHETRPYEVNKGESEAIYKEYLLKINRALKSHNGNIPELLKEVRRVFSQIPKTNDRKPLIGIIGEIFVRHNAFSNEDIIKKVEALGGEVWLAPVEEWLYYVNLMALGKAMNKLRSGDLSKNRFSELLSIIITRFIQKRIEHKFSKPFKGFLKTLKEPTTGEILKNAEPYLHRSFEGEAILSVGKTVDFVKNNASGIISTMPFGCMPGTIVEALLKGLQRDTHIPCFSIAYDGVEATCSEIQLEAFMHQAYEYSSNKNS